MEERLSQLEVYADEHRNDHEDRLKKVEAILKPCKEAGDVERRMQLVEVGMNKIPSGLISNWHDVETQMKTWHSEEKERKEAVRAIWKRMDGFKKMEESMTTLLENIKVKELEDEIENMKFSFANDMKDLYQEVTSSRSG